MNGENGNWKKECIVTPPALIAATPVGATTAICLGQFSLIYFRNVVFPVPALPVRKMFLELWFTSSAASRNISLLRSYSILVIDILNKKAPVINQSLFSGVGRDRTADTRIFSPLLNPLPIYVSGVLDHTCVSTCVT